jgi:hypothetical protein
MRGSERGRERERKKRKERASNQEAQAWKGEKCRME